MYRWWSYAVFGGQAYFCIVIPEVRPLYSTTQPTQTAVNPEHRRHYHSLPQIQVGVTVMIE